MGEDLNTLEKILSRYKWIIYIVLDVLIRGLSVVLTLRLTASGANPGNGPLSLVVGRIALIAMLLLQVYEHRRTQSYAAEDAARQRLRSAEAKLAAEVAENVIQAYGDLHGISLTEDRA